jgi:hypothetical protein
MTTESTKTTLEEDKKENKPENSLPAILRSFPGAPTQEQINAWKTQFGEVFVSGFSETELFIWRAISRPEWVNLQMSAADPELKVDQYKYEEMVCNTCVLWKSVKGTWTEGKAGTPSSLQEQILQNSNFLTPQAAAMLVAKL